MMPSAPAPPKTKMLWKNSKNAASGGVFCLYPLLCKKKSNVSRAREPTFQITKGFIRNGSRRPQAGRKA